MKQQIDIPIEIQDICKKLGKVAQQCGLNHLTGNFRPPLGCGWNADVSFSWKDGRHGEESNEINITSSFFVNTKINPNESGI